MNPPSIAVRVDQLTASYGSTCVLHQVSFEISKGEVFGLLGPNGAGKTTCLKVLLGHKRPDQGVVEVLDTAPIQNSPEWRRRLSWLGDQSGLYLRQTALYNLQLFADLYQAKPGQIEKVSHAFQIEHLLKKYVHQLSKGQKQRLSLARALLQEPEILFLDEPTSGLDIQSAQDLRQAIRRCSQLGTTVLLTTHDLEEAEELCHRVAFLVEGRIGACGTPAELCQRLLGQELIPVMERPGLKKVFWKLTKAEDQSANQSADE